ncbi:MAG: hypothetical protein IKM48_03325 [Clostridia bacterium]|nr:hypothetical protein [Clostridia bacterium]
MENWIADVVGKMHIHKVSQTELAERCGRSRENINRILNGAVAISETGKADILKTLEDLIASKS